MKLSDLFNVSVDDGRKRFVKPKDSNKRPTKVLAIKVDSPERENIETVPQKASAGYIQWLCRSRNFAKSFPVQLPNYRIALTALFEISGESPIAAVWSLAPLFIYWRYDGEVRKSFRIGKKPNISVSEQEGVGL